MRGFQISSVKEIECELMILFCGVIITNAGTHTQTHTHANDVNTVD